MPELSPTSRWRLSTCHPDLQRLFGKLSESLDFTVIEGHRGQERQDKAFREGKSQVKWPNGRHNQIPSRAVDVAPLPLDWNNIPRFRDFAAEVLATAQELKIPIRWGGDWDGDPSTPNRFNDLVHFELKEPK